jgi:hypothetical protein
MPTHASAAPSAGSWYSLVAAETAASGTSDRVATYATSLSVKLRGASLRALRDGADAGASLLFGRSATRVERDPSSCGRIPAMPTPLRMVTRRPGAIGLALAAYDLWRRVPPKQRRQLFNAARKHAPRLAAEAVKRGRAARAGRAAKTR